MVGMDISCCDLVRVEVSKVPDIGLSSVTREACSITGCSASFELSELEVE